MLSEQDGINLCVIDCINHKQDDFQDRKQSFIRSFESNITKYGEPDVLLTYRCPFIIPPYLYEKSRLGAFNIHPSLLPKYKGINPWIEIFGNHESKSGVTLHKITRSIDSGIIVSQKSFILETSDSIESARNKADELAAELAKDFVSNLISNVSLFPLPNKFDYQEAVISRENLLFLDKNDLLEYDGVYKEGSFCIVFQMYINGEKYAVRCWKCLNDINKSSLCHRMKLVSNWMKNVRPIFMNNFILYENGINTIKGIQPVIVMKWCDGMSLKDYLSLHIQDSPLLMKLSDSFVAMISYFHNIHIAHGDLNLDNIRVSTNGSLYIIDYDTLYLPVMEKEKDDKKGKSVYQHHARKSNIHLSEYIDYFSEYIIYLTIRSLAKYPEIWNIFELYNMDSHIFNEEELSNIRGSRIYNFIRNKNDREIMQILHLLYYMWQNENKLELIIPIEKNNILAFRSSNS